MKKLIILSLMAISLFLVGCAAEINSFEDCVNAGNPVMESYPRQCRSGNQTFTEEINETEQIILEECTVRNQACTREYNPVCGVVDNGVRCIRAPCASSDAITFGNSCTACSNESTYGFYKGECESQRFVICDSQSASGINVSDIARQNGWVCVDSCPGNFDSYMTQIGAEVCINEYDEEEIFSWQECNRSSTDCNCVKTTETTKGVVVQNAEYRCVPEQYAERLIFTGGQERLDENGQASAIIA